MVTHPISSQGLLGNLRPTDPVQFRQWKKGAVYATLSLKINQATLRLHAVNQATHRLLAFKTSSDFRDWVKTAGNSAAITTSGAIHVATRRAVVEFGRNR